MLAPRRTELAERLIVQRPDLRVLYMSGYTHDPRALRLIAAGANFLRKPFNAQTFAQRVGELVEPGRAMAGHDEGQQKSISSLGKET